MRSPLQGRPSVRRFVVSPMLAGVALTLAVLPPASAALLQSAAVINREVAVLQGLDKITARVFSIEAPVGQVVRFGTLEIVAQACQERPPEETPESAAFLDISEIKPGEPPHVVFEGWMFASSPAISALEHPVYDVWVVDCRNPEKKSSGTSG